ncbi:MAG: hypothetical protein HC880_01530 [Bacteroidia bacterium]|nr:hypothetical protein [Bacteroidia bacterium]
MIPRRAVSQALRFAMERTTLFYRNEMIFLPITLFQVSINLINIWDWDIQLSIPLLIVTALGSALGVGDNIRYIDQIELIPENKSIRVVARGLLRRQISRDYKLERIRAVYHKKARANFLKIQYQNYWGKEVEIARIKVAPDGSNEKVVEALLNKLRDIGISVSEH